MRYVALFRGVNVGTAKALAMPRLREVFESLGHADVQTVLRSGNVVYTGSTPVDKAAKQIETALEEQCGLSSSVLVLTAARLARIAEANPLLDLSSDPARLLVTVLYDPADAKRLTAPDPESIAPDVLRVGKEAVYQWLPNGISKSRVPSAFWKPAKAPVTGRNWRTIGKLVELSG